MCNLYGSTDAQHLRQLTFAKNLPGSDWDMTVAPLKSGVFIRQHGEAVAGPWGTIPPRAADRLPRSKTTGRQQSTNNARLFRSAQPDSTFTETVDSGVHAEFLAAPSKKPADAGLWLW